MQAPEAIFLKNIYSWGDIADTVEIWYTCGAVLSQPDSGKGVTQVLNIFMGFILSVGAGVVANLICKWLDRHR